MPTKVVVRLLPSSLTEDEFMKSIPEEFQSSVIDFTRFVSGKTVERPTPDNPNENARCYLNFHTYTSACDFVNKFHGKIFTDNRNDQYRAVAAFAPFQRTPKPWKQLKNSLENTIAEDVHFQDFISKGHRLIVEPPVAHKPTEIPSIAPLAKSLLNSTTLDSQRSKDSNRSSNRSKKPKPDAKEPTKESSQTKQPPKKANRQNKKGQTESKQKPKEEPTTHASDKKPHVADKKPKIQVLARKP